MTTIRSETQKRKKKTNQGKSRGIFRKTKILAPRDLGTKYVQPLGGRSTKRDEGSGTKVNTEGDSCRHGMPKTCLKTSLM